MIHYTLMEIYGAGEHAGVKFPDQFEYMLERPKSEYFGQEQYPSVIEKACCYYHSIVKGHIFHNGNKRTALTVFETFLNLNGYELNLSEQEAEDFTVYLAENEKFKSNDSVEILVAELKNHIVPL